MCKLACGFASSDCLAGAEQQDQVEEWDPEGIADDCDPCQVAHRTVLRSEGRVGVGWVVAVRSHALEGVVSGQVGGAI